MFKYIIILLLTIAIPAPAQQRGGDIAGELNQFIEADNLYQEGARALHDGDYQLASTHLNNALQKFPLHADAHYHLSWLAYREGDYFKALIHIRRAKDTFSAFHLMEQQLYRRTKAALETKKRSLQRQILILQAQADITDWSADTTINNPARAKILATKQEMRRVETKLQTLVPPPSNIPSDYYLFHGNIFVKLKKFKEARREYEAAKRIAPDATEAADQLDRLKRQLDGSIKNKKINQTTGGKDGTY
jgi:tetratricopeptide (TPR) repeat protein